MEIKKFKNLIGLNNIKLAIYGAGNGYYTFKKYVLDKYNYIPYCTIDKFKVGKIDAYGKSIIDIESFKECSKDNNVIIIITIGDQNIYNSVKLSLIDQGFENIFSPSSFYEYNSCYSDLTIDQLLKKFENDKERIEFVKKTLYDEKSREVYDGFLNFFKHCGNKEIASIVNEKVENIYVLENISKQSFSRTINCGAYNGDTILSLWKKFGAYDSLLCFDPNTPKFIELCASVMKKSSFVKNGCFCIPGATSNKTGIVEFDDSMDMNSSIAIGGGRKVNCFKIDDFKNSFNATAIIMDIEGAELKTLEGSISTIRKHNPYLAISCYHYPWHIYDLPWFIIKNFPNYKIYLRNYSSITDSTILYGVPK